MLLTKIISITLFAAAAQVSAQTLASTAGVPATQNVGNGASTTTIPTGLEGSSTGTSVAFGAGSTSAPPSSSVVSTSATGSAAAAMSSSISQNAAQGSGSDGMYTSTTGGAIAGISTGLSGGYDASTPGTTGGGGTVADSTLPQLHLDGLITWMMAITAGLVGALIVL